MLNTDEKVHQKLQILYQILFPYTMILFKSIHIVHYMIYIYIYIYIYKVSKVGDCR